MKQRTGATSERIALAREAAQLRARGLLLRQVAAHLGTSTSYASALITDPDGSKARARKDRYAGECEECGAPTSGGDGRAKAPKICCECEADIRHLERRWTPETIIAAFQAFVRRTGHAPAASDIYGHTPSGAARYSEERLSLLVSDHGLPGPAIVQREFGSWRAGLEAAGLPVSNGGAPAHRTDCVRTAARREVLQLLRYPRTVAFIAQTRGITDTGARSSVLRLRQLGLVTQTREYTHGPHGHAGLFVLTPAGREFLRRFKDWDA